MKTLIIITTFLTLISCNNSSLQTKTLVIKSIHIPDTTNNRYAKLFDYTYYQEKSAIAKQLNLDTLETDTSNSEIRIWTIGSNYNPQKIFFLKKINKTWTISKLIYYLHFSETQIKVDSISTQGKNEREILLNEFNLLKTDQIWQLPSQSEMKNGAKYGCNDGYALLIEMNDKSKYKFSCYTCPDLHIAKDSVFKTVLDFEQKVGELLTLNKITDK
jgi:hypothetical protein